MPAVAPARENDADARIRGGVVFTLALLVALAAVWYLRDLLLLLYASALFAVLVNPFVEAVERKRIGSWRPGRGIAIGVVVAGMLLGALLLARMLVPPVWAESATLAGRWPKVSANILAALQHNALLRRFDLQHFAPSLSEAGAMLVSFAGRLAVFVADFSTVLLLTVYLLAEGRESLDWALSFVREPRRDRLAQTLDRAQQRMRGWLLGQSMLSAILTLLSLCVFGALHLPYFYLLALVTGLLSFVPILGPVTAIALTGSVAASQSWSKLAVVIAFYVLYETVDDIYLTPRVMRGAVDVSGLGIIVAIAIGGALAGALGALLAVPSAALVAELLHEYGRS